MTEIVSEYLSQIPLFILTGAIGFLVGAIYTWTAAWSYSERRVREMIPFNRAIEEYQLDEEYTPATTDKEKAFMKIVARLKDFQSEIKHSMGLKFESEIQSYSEFISDMADRFQTKQKDEAPRPHKVKNPYLSFKPIAVKEVLEKVRFTNEKEMRSYKITFEEGFNSGKFADTYYSYIQDCDPSGMYLYLTCSYENLNSILDFRGAHVDKIWDICEMDSVSRKFVQVFAGNQKAIRDSKIEAELDAIETMKNKKKKHDSSKKRNLLG